MITFNEKLFNILLFVEGEYSNTKGDRGRATIYGISSRFHPEDFERVYELYKEKQIEKAKEEARKYYEENEWKHMECELLPDENIAYIVFDSAVNCGKKVATRQLQYSLNFILKILNKEEEIKPLVCDGIIGPKTKEMIEFITNHIKDDEILKRKMFHQILSSRMFYYTSRKNKRFLTGWINRLARIVRKLEEI